MSIRTLALATLLTACATSTLTAQGIIVDQGQFAIHIGGRAVGVEDFVIRRAGLGSNDAVFANGVISVSTEGATQEVRPLLRTAPPGGTVASYQVRVSGPDAMDVRLVRSGRRYVATIGSKAGNEDREFQAHADTRVLELGVAHHYYFLRGVRNGSVIHVLEPRSRRQLTLTAGEHSEQELRLGPNVISARRVEYSSDHQDHRVVWFDRQGRVLRVEIPNLNYVAARTDLVG